MRLVLRKVLAIRLVILRTTFFMFLFCVQKAHKNSISANLFLAQEKNHYFLPEEIWNLFSGHISNQVRPTRQSQYARLLQKFLASQSALRSLLLFSPMNYPSYIPSHGLTLFLYSFQRVAFHGTLFTMVDSQTPLIILTLRPHVISLSRRRRQLQTAVVCKS